MNLNEIRQEYLQKPLTINDETSPTELLKLWYQDAIDDEINLLNAVTLSTVDKNGFPNARIVLAKDITDKGLIIYTDYSSQKGIEIESNPNVAITIFWKAQDRQIRIKAQAKKISYEDSNKYFQSRPLDSQISASASYQSKDVSLEELNQKILELSKSTDVESLQCPQRWGGFLLEYKEIEFWQGRPNRLHDRFQFKKENEKWSKSKRLSP